MNVFIASIEGSHALLTPEESWHCFKVLRKKSGDAVHLIDGQGNFYEGDLDLVSEKRCTVVIKKGPVKQTPRPYRLHLGIAPTKQMDRIEWMVEKAVEIGIDEISFIQCRNSERIILKTERIYKIVESAVKQSLQALIPKVNELMPFKNILSMGADHKLIAHCFDNEKQNIRNLGFANTSTIILIGPEGDFSMEEVRMATEQGFNAISLGENRLRSETAGLYVCQAVSLLS